MNLIQKMISKMANTKVGKKLFVGAVALTMAANTAAFVACAKVNPDDLEPKTKIEQPENPENIDPENPTDPEQEVVDKTTSEYLLSQIDLNQYSAPLQKVLSDEYYMKIRNGESHRNDLGWNEGSEIINRYKAIPYGNLNLLGYTNEDIYRILNDEYFAESFVYIKDGDLYVALNAEHKPGSEVYCGSFLLKYELTDHELYDLEKIYKLVAGTGDFNYIEAPLFIQALSQLKTPEVISKAYATEGALEGSLDSCKNINNVEKPVFMIYTGKEQYNDLSLSEAGIYSMSLFINNKSNAVSDATYVNLATTKDNISKFNDGNDILNASINWKAKLKRMNKENTLQSSLVPVTRLNYGTALLQMTDLDHDEIKYLRSIDYTSSLEK